MKKLLLLSATAVMMTVAATAQTATKDVKYELNTLHNDKMRTRKEIKMDKKDLRKLEGHDVSYQSRQAFNSDFSNVTNATWERDTYFDKVTFTDKKGKIKTAYYDYDAELIGTTTPKYFRDLPAKAQKYINEKYSGYSKGPVFFFVDNEDNASDMVFYDDPFGGTDNYFVELKNGNQETILRVDPSGDVYFFKKI